MSTHFLTRINLTPLKQYLKKIHWPPLAAGHLSSVVARHIPLFPGQLCSQPDMLLQNVSWLLMQEEEERLRARIKLDYSYFTHKIIPV